MQNIRRHHISSAVAFLSGTNKLRNEQFQIEKSHEKLISGLKSFSVHERNELLEYARILETDLHKDVDEKQEELFKLFGSLKQLKAEVSSPKQVSLHEVSYFRGKVDDVERRVQALQDNCVKELQKLRDEESLLTTQLAGVENLIEEWGNCKILASLKASQISIKQECTCDNGTTLTPEVQNFQRFLERNGGHYGGWAEEDHLFFLQVRQKHDTAATAYLVSLRLPDKSIPDVVAHDSWFSTYKEMKRDQDRSIREWRNNYKPKHSMSCEHQETSSLVSKISSTVNSELNEAKKIKVLLWKDCKKQLQRLELEDKMLSEELKKREDELKKQKQAKMKAAVEKYKANKAIYEDAVKLATEVEDDYKKMTAAKHAASMSKFYRDEAMKYGIEMRRRLLKPNECKPGSATKKRTESATKVKRDPLRIMMPTLGWCAKTAKTDDDYTQSKSYVHLRNMPRLRSLTSRLFASILL